MGPFDYRSVARAVPTAGSTFRARHLTMWHMKRTVATILWLFSAWYAGSTLSAFMGVPDLLGPIFGIATAMIVGLDPRHTIWYERASATRGPASPA